MKFEPFTRVWHSGSLLAGINHSLPRTTEQCSGITTPINQLLLTVVESGTAENEFETLYCTYDTITHP